MDSKRLAELMEVMRGFTAALADHAEAMREHAEALRLEAGEGADESTMD